MLLGLGAPEPGGRGHQESSLEEKKGKRLDLGKCFKFFCRDGSGSITSKALTLHEVNLGLISDHHHE